MKIRITKYIALLTLVSLFTVACSSVDAGSPPSMGMAGMDMESTNASASHNMVHVETPEEFAGMTNPYTNDADAIAAGKVTFTTLCATCHGDSGDGDGPAAAGLTPAPAKLSDSMMMGELGDDYLFWRVSKGGAMDPFNSAMVAWESALTEEQRWQVVSYVRTLSGTDSISDDDHAN